MDQQEHAKSLYIHLKNLNTLFVQQDIGSTPPHTHTHTHTQTNINTHAHRYSPCYNSVLKGLLMSTSLMLLPLQGKQKRKIVGGVIDVMIGLIMHDVSIVLRVN